MIAWEWTTAEKAAARRTPVNPIPPPPSSRHAPSAPRIAAAGNPDVLGEAIKLAKDMFRNRKK